MKAYDIVRRFYGLDPIVSEDKLVEMVANDGRGVQGMRERRA